METLSAVWHACGISLFWRVRGDFDWQLTEAAEDGVFFECFDGKAM